MIGLDMDHTLVRYHSENFELLVFSYCIKDLVEYAHYPEMILKLNFHYEDAIRGLVIDRVHGNILKVSRYGLIRTCWHGSYLMAHDEQIKFYRSTYVDLNDSNYIAVDTAFSISFCVLYGLIVDLKDAYPDKFPSYQQIASDVMEAVDRVHGKGDMKRYILENHESYIKVDPEVVKGLQHFIAHGKKFFILTNSDFFYTTNLLKITIEPFLKPGQTIHDLFPYIITLANKPRFFYDNLKFLSVQAETGLMSNLEGKIVPGIYQGGNTKKLTYDLNLKEDEILYIGDHIYGDIVRLKKHCNWRTALVVEELGDEIKRQTSALPIESKIIQLMKTKQSLEIEYAWQSTNVEIKDKKHLVNIQKDLHSIDDQLTTLIKEQEKYFNAKWGKIFRTGAEETFFAFQAERYACIYMEKLSDLLNLPPVSYFRAYRRMLGHDFFSA